MSATDCRTIESKVLKGERLSADEGLLLLSPDFPLAHLGLLAQHMRFAKNPRLWVTYLIDSNPNYTNVCDAHCRFCAFARKPGDKDAYALTVEQVMSVVQKAVDQGATTILLQGGHNRDLPLSYYVDIVREMKLRFPRVTPHCFSASEIHTMAEVSGKSIGHVLDALWEAGQRSLPGGGAEVLADGVRKKVSPKKGGVQAWLDVHRAAHKRGYKSTATMMYGHEETDRDIVEHWGHVRALQDETRGFTAFIPWSFKPTNSALEKRFPERAGPVTYLRILAASRLYLDNVPHIQASWFSEGKKTGQAALHFGADDFGGTLIDENVHAAADYVNKAGPEEVMDLIRGAGFVPAQRDTFYDILKEFN